MNTAALSGLGQRLNPLRWLRPRIPGAGPITLDRRRIYILPTRGGLTFALVQLAILTGAINYSNSLAYALVFLLAGLTVISILHTHRNLAGLTLQRGRCAGVFAGDTLRFPLGIDNPLPHTRLAVSLQRQGEAAITVDLPPGLSWIELPVAARRRGRLALGRLTVSTRFPLGLFRAWSPLLLEMSGLVYPAPAPQRGLPPPLASASQGNGHGSGGQEDFAALRPYHAGDSLRHVHWKALAREQGLQTKQFAGGQHERLWLHWDQLPGLGTEVRLSRLCRWVLEAHQGGLVYGLVLPGQRLEPARGEAHRRRCLEALALFGERP